MSPTRIFAHYPSLMYSQFFVTPPYPGTNCDCSGKTIVVTGANTGLGKEAAHHFLRLNVARVIMACRSVEKAEAAKREIEAKTGRKDRLSVWKLDLADYASVKAFAERVGMLGRVDAVVENAGISTLRFVDVAGNESTITVNVVSTFYLSLLLLPKLKERAKTYDIVPTITIVSSEIHYFTTFPESREPVIFSALNDPAKAHMTERYFVSKLLEVLVCREVAGKLPVSGLQVTLNFVNPGWCESELMRDLTNPVARWIIRRFQRTTEVGSRALVNAALAGPETHGKYLSDCQISRCAPLVEGKNGSKLQKRLWEELGKKLEAIEPGVTMLMKS